jgi:hypothetical protein
MTPSKKPNEVMKIQKSKNDALKEAEWGRENPKKQK